jgi:hypothetical protein
MAATSPHMSAGQKRASIPCHGDAGKATRRICACILRDVRGVVCGSGGKGGGTGQLRDVWG